MNGTTTNDRVQDNERPAAVSSGGDDYNEVAGESQIPSSIASCCAEPSARPADPSIWRQEQAGPRGPRAPRRHGDRRRHRRRPPRRDTSQSGSRKAPD